MDALCCLICVIAAGCLLVKAYSRPRDGQAAEPAAPEYRPAPYRSRSPQPYLPAWPVCDAVRQTAAAVNHLEEVAASSWTSPAGVVELVAEAKAVTGEAVQMIFAAAHASGPDLWRLPAHARDRLDAERNELDGLSRDLYALATEIGSAAIRGHADRVRELRWRVAALTEALREFPEL